MCIIYLNNAALKNLYINSLQISLLNRPINLDKLI